MALKQYQFPISAGESDKIIRIPASEDGQNVLIEIGGTSSVLGGNLPTGTLIASLASTAPDGWLLCDGQAVSRTTYANLFAAISTKFGDGDGFTTFNVPDLRDKFPQGANGNLGSTIEAGLPAINGTTYLVGQGTIEDSGAFETQSNISVSNGTSGQQYKHRYISFDASRCSKVYGKSSTVQPPAVAVNYFIKC